MKQISFDTSIYNMCVYENSIYVKLANELVKIDMETYDQKTVCSGEASYVAMYKDQVSYYILEDNGNHIVSEIKDINNGNITLLGAMPIGLQHSEFSTIARIWNHQLIGSCYGNQGIRIFTCDIDSGKCQYIIH